MVKWLAWLSAISAFGAPGGGYVGSKACFGCHADIYRSYTKTSMGRSMSLASDLSSFGISSGETTTPLPSGERRIRVYHDGDGWHQSESDPGVFTDDHVLQYAIGSGVNGVTFAVQRGDYLFQAPLSYYSRTRQWDLSPGYQSGDYAFNRPIHEACLACHSGRSNPIPNTEGGYQNPPLSELAIGCENCHGPGERHVREQGKRADSIVNPAKLPARLAENICMNCHQAGDARILQPGRTYQDFRPGEWLNGTIAIFRLPLKLGQTDQKDLLEHNAAMQLSRCFRASQGKLSCLTCHDPHVQPSASEAVAYYRAKCLTCHTNRDCKLSLRARMEGTPANDCIGCHMPKRDVTIIAHSALTNHRIPARPGELLPREAFNQTTPELPDLVHLNRPAGQSDATLPKITLLRAYGELMDRDPALGEGYRALLDDLAKTDAKNLYVQAALGRMALSESRDAEALPHLTTAAALNSPDVFQDMATAFDRLGRIPDAVNAFEKAVRLSPYNPVLRKKLTLEYIKAHRYTEARGSMEEYVKLFPQDSFMRKLLAKVAQ